MAEELLGVRGITKHFGGFVALDGVSFSLGAGEALGLVGPNGSGKTTLVNVACGLFPPTKGEIRLAGARVDGQPAHKVARKGINRTFQIPRPFHTLTVRENISLAIGHCPRAGLSMEEILAFCNLAEVSTRKAGMLTAAQQKRLDLARALALGPSVLFVDELGAGLNHGELAELARMLRSLSDRGIALVVVEHLMGFLEQVVDHVIVLNAGREIFRGELRSALADAEVKRVYLGDSVSA